MITTMSDAGVRFLIGEEEVRLRPYYDSVGVPTIGVGCTMYEDGRRLRLLTRRLLMSGRWNCLSGC